MQTVGNTAPTRGIIRGYCCRIVYGVVGAAYGKGSQWAGSQICCRDSVPSPVPARHVDGAGRRVSRDRRGRLEMLARMPEKRPWPVNGAVVLGVIGGPIVTPAESNCTGRGRQSRSRLGREQKDAALRGILNLRAVILCGPDPRGLPSGRCGVDGEI